MGFSPEPSCEPALKREKKIKTAFPPALKALLLLLKQGFHLSQDRLQVGKKEGS